MKTNITYNKEVIDVKFNTWVDANIHLPEIEEVKDKNNYNEDYGWDTKSSGDLKIDLTSEYPEDRECAIDYLKLIIEEVKSINGEQLDLDKALIYYEKYDNSGFSEETIFYFKQNGIYYTHVARFSKSSHNDFSIGTVDMFEFIFCFKIKNNLIKMNRGDEEIEIIKWMPLPSCFDKKWKVLGWEAPLSDLKPKNGSRVIVEFYEGNVGEIRLINDDDKDRDNEDYFECYAVAYYINGHFISIYEKQCIVIHPNRWMYLPEKESKK